jgi:hypothetical protein
MAASIESEVSWWVDCFLRKTNDTQLVYSQTEMQAKQKNAKNGRGCWGAKKGAGVAAQCAKMLIQRLEEERHLGIKEAFGFGPR